MGLDIKKFISIYIFQVTFKESYLTSFDRTFCIKVGLMKRND